MLKINKFKKSIGLILTIFIICSVFFNLFSVKKTEAQFKVFDPVNSGWNSGNWFTNIAFKAQQAVHNKLIELKEYVLDGLAWTAANVIIDKFADSLVTWIQNGFEGSPMFLSDPEGFFKDTANDISGAIINDLNMNWLCDALGKFRLDLDFFLPGTSRSQYACTFEDIVDNVRDVAGRDELGDWIDVDISVNQQNIVRRFGDDFRNGGFYMWLAVADPKNNLIGRTMTTADSVYVASETQVEKEKFGLSVNGGFFGMRKCVEWMDSKTGQKSDSEKCARYIDTSPGQMVQDQLNHASNKDLARLQVSDEIDEIIGALATTMIGWMLTGGNEDGGVLGYDSGAEYSGSNRDHYGELSKSQKLNKEKNNISSQITTIQNSEDQYSGALEDYADAVYGTKEKLQVVLMKLECIYATSTSDTTYNYSSCDGKVEKAGKNLSANGKTSSDVSSDITDVKSAITGVESRITTFNNNYGSNATSTSEQALEIIDSFDEEVMQATKQKTIDELIESYCFDYDKKTKTAEICGLFGDDETETTYKTHSDKEYKNLNKEAGKIETKMEAIMLKYSCILDEYTDDEDVSGDECVSARSSSSSASS